MIVYSVPQMVTMIRLVKLHVFSVGEVPQVRLKLISKAVYAKASTVNGVSLTTNASASRVSLNLRHLQYLESQLQLTKTVYPMSRLLVQQAFISTR